MVKSININSINLKINLTALDKTENAWTYREMCRDDWSGRYGRPVNMGWTRATRHTSTSTNKQLDILLPQIADLWNWHCNSSTNCKVFVMTFSKSILHSKYYISIITFRKYSSHNEINGLNLKIHPVLMTLCRSYLPWMKSPGFLLPKHPSQDRKRQSRRKTHDWPQTGLQPWLGIWKFVFSSESNYFSIPADKSILILIRLY